MDSTRRPGAFSPFPPSAHAVPPHRVAHRRSRSSESDSSGASQATALSSAAPLAANTQPLSATGQALTPTSANSFARPSITQVSGENPIRRPSPLNPTSDARSHKRNNSQGFFEPSLPTASLAELYAMPGLSASQIAAQAAMQHQQRGASQHVRKRSQTVPSPQSPPENNRLKGKPPPLPATQPPAVRKLSGAPAVGLLPPNGVSASPTVAAATAANAAFPRAVQLSPGLTTFSEASSEKDARAKPEKSKMKLFSKPKHIGISSHKDTDRREKPLPSPGKAPSPGPSALSKAASASTVSLVDSNAATPGSIYSTGNASTSTLVPKVEDKEKASRHNFLSRQKNKFKEKNEEHSLSFSSAPSAPRPIELSAPLPIPSFVPSSPGPSQGSFSKSVSGLDLRHGGRALREKWREEKASTLPDARKQDGDKPEWSESTAAHTTAVNNAWMIAGVAGGETASGQWLGLPNVAAEDAWELLKAKMFVIFEGEDVRASIEDLNKLVLLYLQQNIQRQSPAVIIEDVRDYLLTGLASAEQTLKGVPDDKLVPYLVEMWLFVFGSVLPCVQAVFLPLDLELRGSGPLQSFHEAADFWGFDPDAEPEGGDNALDVRRIVLLAYRDAIILPRHDALTAIFSRLSLDSFDVGPGRTTLGAELPPPPSPRPGTAGSLGPAASSYNSQATTLLSEGSAAAAARSRTTSNTSAPELPSFSPAKAPPAPIAAASSQAPHLHQVQVQRQADSARVTESVARMLQCMSVLVGLRSGDAAQEKMEALVKALKLNWLGRGRTGRNRKGFVGARPGRANRL